VGTDRNFNGADMGSWYDDQGDVEAET